MASIIEIIAKFLNEASPGLKQVDQDIAGLDKTTQETDTSTQGLGSTFSGLIEQFGGGLSVLGALSTGFAFLKSTVDAYGESEVVAAQVNAVLQSTQQVAGLTAEEIGNIADELSRMSGADDEAIMRGEALLLTFTKIGKEVFPDATEAALNMSMAMGTDMKESIIQVGKALNEPIQGVTALRRVGVQLTDQQEEQIRKFIELNDIASAQKIILSELNTEFGGVAAAMGDTLVGASNKLDVAWGNLKEAIGSRLAPEVTNLKLAMADLLNTITDNIEEGNKYADVVDEVNEMYGLNFDQMKRAMASNSDFAETVNATRSQLQRGAEMTAFYSQQVETMTEAQAGAVETMTEYVPQWDKLLDISTKLSDETDKYNEKQQTVVEKQADIKAKIDELIAQGWSPLSDKVKDLQADYDELGVKYDENAQKHQEAMGKIQYDLLVTKLSVDGLTDSEYQMAQQAGLMFGVFNQESLDSARNMDLVTQAVSEGKIKVEDMQRALDGLSKGYTIDVVMNVINGLAGYGNTTSQNHVRPDSGRASGGPVQAGRMYEVNEGGIPELLSFGGRQFLMMPNADGYVNPPSTAGFGGGGGNIINVYVTIAPQGVTVLDEHMTGELLKPYVVQAVNEARAEGQLSQ